MYFDVIGDKNIYGYAVEVYMCKSFLCHKTDKKHRKYESKYAVDKLIWKCGASGAILQNELASSFFL